MASQSVKRGFKILGYGFLLLIITMVLLLIMSFITGSDQPVDYWWVGIVVAVIMSACSLWFSRLMHAASTKQALILGIIWALMLTAILLIIAVPNGTVNVVFGQWSAYLVFIGVAVGPVLIKPKAAIPPMTNNQKPL